MIENQAFKFLARFGNPHDVKIILREKKPGFFGALWVAWRLSRGVPVAKIINKKWFYGLPFYTNRHTLDPRPDSETLVDAVLKNERGAKKILDLGMGTGCLLCAALKHLPNAAGVGIDKSGRACRIARKNAKNLGLENRIEIFRGTFAGYDAADFDLIVSNPPYIAIGDVVDRGARHDPGTALYGGRDGLRYYREIARIKTNAKLYLEIGAGQEKAVQKIFADAGWRFVSGHKDLSGRVRVLSFSSK